MKFFLKLIFLYCFVLNAAIAQQSLKSGISAIKVFKIPENQSKPSSWARTAPISTPDSIFVNNVPYIWFKGGYVAKNRKIIFLDQESTDKNALIAGVINSFASLLGIPASSIILKKKCDCDNLYLLEGPNLYSVEIEPDPGNGSSGNDNFSDNDPLTTQNSSLSKKYENSIQIAKSEGNSGDSLILNKCSDDIVKIAIVDNGINTNLLNTNSVSQYWFKRKDFLRNGDESILEGLNFTDSQDLADLPLDTSNNYLGHGTLVSHIITNHQEENIRVLPLKVLHNSQGSLFDALCAVQFAAKNNFDLINCSWGHGGQKNKIFERVIHNLKGRDITLIASAGNDSANYRIPTSLNRWTGISHYPGMFSHNNRNVINVTTSIGNYDETYTSLSVTNNQYLNEVNGVVNKEYTSYAAALITGFFTKNIQTLRIKRAKSGKSTEDSLPTLRSLFYNLDARNLIRRNMQRSDVTFEGKGLVNTAKL